jgi:hypothetical protein
VIYVEDVDGVGVIADCIANAVLAAPGSPLSLEGLAVMERLPGKQ